MLSKVVFMVLFLDPNNLEVVSIQFGPINEAAKTLC